MMAGLGCVIGPLIGTSLYASLGYEMTFYIFGIANILLSCVIYINFPRNSIILTVET